MKSTVRASCFSLERLFLLVASHKYFPHSQFIKHILWSNEAYDKFRTPLLMKECRISVSQICIHFWWNDECVKYFESRPVRIKKKGARTVVFIKAERNSIHHIWACYKPRSSRDQLYLQLLSITSCYAEIFFARKIILHDKSGTKKLKLLHQPEFFIRILMWRYEQFGSQFVSLSNPHGVYWNVFTKFWLAISRISTPDYDGWLISEVRIFNLLNKKHLDIEYFATSEDQIESMFLLSITESDAIRVYLYCRR